MRRLAVLAALLAAPALAKQPPRAARVYTDCVLDAFKHPGAEKGATFDDARDLARVQCGNLRPAAVEAVRRTFTAGMTRGGDDPESAAQSMLDIVILEQTAEVWAARHPGERYHGR